MQTKLLSRGLDRILLEQGSISRLDRRLAQQEAIQVGSLSSHKQRISDYMLNILSHILFLFMYLREQWRM